MQPFYSLLFLVAFTTSSLFAQYTDTTRTADFDIHDQYAVNPWVSVPVIALGAWGSQTRLKKLQDKPGLTPLEVANRNPDDVPGIDRIALRQDFDKHKQAIVNSDNLFGFGQFAPFSLFIWKKYRKNWLDISLMYFEAQVTQGLFYGFAPFGPTGIDRYRPRVYYDEAEFESRTNGNQKNSSFSGHVSTMSTGFYFTAKMIDDHNPQFTGGQRVLLYTGASIPSLVGGWMRVRGLKHYPTDVAIGLGVGAISGILVPELHRWWERRHKSKMMLRPVYGNGAAGAGFSLIF